MSNNIIYENEYEKVIEEDNHLYVINKKELIGIVPYTIENGVLTSIGLKTIVNKEEEEFNNTLLIDYVTSDDINYLNAASRILDEKIDINIKKGEEWIYLGDIVYNHFSKSNIHIYGVDITHYLNELKSDNFQLISINNITQNNDILFLSIFTRLFNYFYVKSLIKKDDE